jgi:hypothetical protein
MGKMKRLNDGRMKDGQAGLLLPQQNYDVPSYTK